MIFGGHFVCAPSQWETTLHCNVVSHWQGAYTEWFLDFTRFESKMNLVRICWIAMTHAFTKDHFDGLMQERCNSIANALELHLSCINPSPLYGVNIHYETNKNRFHCLFFLRITESLWKMKRCHFNWKCIYYLEFLDYIKRSVVSRRRGWSETTLAVCRHGTWRQVARGTRVGYTIVTEFGIFVRPPVAVVIVILFTFTILSMLISGMTETFNYNFFFFFITKLITHII